MAAKPTLKPCPFCGGEAKLLRYLGERAVACSSDIGCLVNPITEFMTEDEAIRAWNTRPMEP